VTATPDPQDDREPFTIRVANSLWGQHGYPFLEEFLMLLAEQYDAGMHLVDFASAAEDARRTINDWVEDQTEGRIVDLIPEGAVTGLTRLVLVNAIWFKANWAEQFSPDDTADGPFTRLDGSVVTVPMMHRSGRIEFMEGDGYVAARLPYAGDASMLVIVPDEGLFPEIARAFGPDDLSEVRELLQIHQVDLTLPRFEFRSELGLKPPLREMGIVAAFVEPSRPDGADLTGMTAERELFVHDVVHQAFISVDEQGTEAAAATAVIIGLESAPPPATLTADRPFLFLIQHDTTGEILFLGQVADPS
jgi:serpin B